MDDLMKTTLLLIESEQRNEELIKKLDTALIQLLQKERIIDRLIKEKNELKNK